MCKAVFHLFSVLPLCLQGAAWAQGTSQRPMEPEDLLRAATIGEPTFSPDGRRAAFVVDRPKTTALRFGLQIPFSNADIWVVPTGGGRAQNITHGEADGASFWAPRWAPDGRYLAMLSTRNGNVRVWVWNEKMREPKPVTDRGTTLFLREDLHWASGRELVVPVLPKGEKNFGFVLTGFGETIRRSWLDAHDGRASTASVITAGVKTATDRAGEHLELHLINVETGSDVLLDKAPFFITLRLSPDGRTLAYLRKVADWYPDSTMVRVRRYGFLSAVYDLGIADLEHRNAHSVSEAHDIFWGSISWSKDSSEVAVVSSAGIATDTATKISRCAVATGKCTPLQRPLDLGLWADAVDRSPFVWCGAHNLFVLGRGENRASASDKRVGMIWWKADEAGALQPFLVGASMPDQLVPGVGETLLGLKDGAVWEYDLDGRALRNVSSTLPSKVVSFERLAETDSPLSPLLLRTREGVHESLYLVEAASGSLIPIEMPAPEASLVAYHARKHSAIFLDADWTGARLWLTGSSAREAIFETNTFLREIRPSVFRRLEYRGLEGQSLNAWVLLPDGYQPGRQYPVVIWVYLVHMYGKEPPKFEVDPNSSQIFNLQLLAAHGYAVLLPSMPRKPSIEEQDVYSELANGVLPAVDKLIDIGIANPARIGIMGHSFGGYSTYGLITQTNRFKAAVASAGFSDLLSNYGVFSMTERYQPTELERTLRFWLSEINASMGVPPWRDAQRYFRNSPLLYANRVETPLLILHGDVDPVVPIEQAEEFFTALQRQNKPVTFVRYLGEGHVLQSPANIRDMWQRIYAWFDALLKKSEEAKPTTEQKPN